MHAAVLRCSAAKQERVTCLEFESPVEHGNLDHVTGSPCLYREKKKKAMAKSLVGVMIFLASTRELETSYTWKRVPGPLPQLDWKEKGCSETDEK